MKRKFRVVSACEDSHHQSYSTYEKACIACLKMLITEGCKLDHIDYSKVNAGWTTFITEENYAYEVVDMELRDRINSLYEYYGYYSIDELKSLIEFHYDIHKWINDYTALVHYWDDDNGDYYDEESIYDLFEDLMVSLGDE